MLCCRVMCFLLLVVDHCILDREAGVRGTELVSKEDHLLCHSTSIG